MGMVEALMPAPQPYPQAHLDAMARQAGFPDYATWQAWNAHRSAALQNQGPQQTQPPTNWLQSIFDKIPIHPAYLFNHIADAMGNIGNGQ